MGVTRIFGSFMDRTISMESRESIMLDMLVENSSNQNVGYFLSNMILLYEGKALFKRGYFC